MGEAFKDGERLGGATGATKRDVLEQLERNHPEADEIRIRTLEGTAERETDVALELAITTSGERMLPYFRFAHLPPRLQKASSHFALLAVNIVHDIPSNPERTVALRKLLEAKDCAVRALLP